MQRIPTWFVSFVLVTLSSSSNAQTSVDRLIQSIQSLSLTSFSDWKASPDLKSYKPAGDPTRHGFDDSGWQTISLDQNLALDSCWFRKEVVVPERILGKPVSGVLRLVVAVDDYGYMWVNGVSKGHFPWNGDFELTKNAQPGEKFLVAIKAVNTGGPLRLIRAEVQSESLKPLRERIEDFTLSLRVGQKLLSFDTYQTNARQRTDPGIDKSPLDHSEKTGLNDLLQSVASRVDAKGLLSVPLEQFDARLSVIRQELKPVSAFAKRFTLYFDANAHIDASWLWRDVETIEVCKNTFESVLHMMDVRPDFTYTQSSAAYYDWMERLYPESFDAMRRRIKDGRWEVVGGMWVEPDCNLPGGESWMRHLLYSKRYFRSKLGVDVKIGWNPDSFGYNWNMPQFYANAGIDAFITQKIGWNETNVFLHRVFWWESPDGSRVLSYFPFDYVNEVTNPYRLVDWLRQFEANTGFSNMLVLFGVGDHGGGPSLEMLARIDRLKTLDIYPSVELGNTASYLAWIRQQDLTHLPVWTDELYLEYHQGTFTTQAKMKEENRRAEVLLTNAEKFSTLSTLTGANYNSDNLEAAWRLTLFNQFHDILPGSGIRENYIDANEKYAEVENIGTFELKRALESITARINTSSIRNATPLVVFNALSWERTDLARFDLPQGNEDEYVVSDAQGKVVPSQIVQKDRLNREILFLAENVPLFGYKLYQLRKQKRSSGTTPLKASKTSIENEFFKISIDPETGWVASILDKRVNKEILNGPANELELLADYPSAWDAWNIGLTGVKYPSRLRRIEVAEAGDVRAIVRVHRDYLKPGTKKDFPTEDFPSSFFTQDIILHQGLDRIDFTTKVDWWEEKTFLKVAFPLAISDTVATFEIPFGTIQRSTLMRDSWEKAKVEVPAQRWADLSQQQYGVSLLNYAKHGYEVKGNTMRLSLLRSPKWPDPTADRGKHSIRYALYPHRGTWKDASTVQRGYEFNNPLIVFPASLHKGSLPGVHSFIQLSPSNLVLTTLKKAEDGNAWIVQWYDSKGEDSEAKLTLPVPPKSVVLSNFMEEEVAPVNVRKNVVTAPTKKNSVVTLRVSF
ncbi:MAG: alpha-mannosidase [Ignavibacteriales bacterium]|nr:alpha-mannosidase [Ignavibacteriales bacterium]